MTARMQEPKARAYFPHVEGLRGVAALYVFLYHLWQAGVAHAGATLGVLLPFTLPWLQFGHFAVTVFIVISGYCLGLPVAARPDRPFSIAAFARRRLRRLGPAYVLALFLSLIPFYAVLALEGRHVAAWHVGAAIVAHLALVHNLIPSLTEYLNGPMWSIALECQIYVVFALLLVPVWRRFGPWAQLAIALAIGLSPQFLFHGKFAYVIPWLLGLFAMGFVAAHVTARRYELPPALRWIALLAGIGAIVAVLPLGDAAQDGALWPADLAVGVAVALFFVTSARGQAPVTARVLALRPVVILGTFSYSLYLIHGPIVSLVAAAITRFNLGVAGSAIAYGVTLVAVVALAYLFYLVAERPYLSPEFRAAIEHAPETPAHETTPRLAVTSAAYEAT